MNVSKESFINDQGGKHIRYNDITKEWTFRVEHFTKYKFIKKNGKVVAGVPQEPQREVTVPVTEEPSIISEPMDLDQ